MKLDPKKRSLVVVLVWMVVVPMWGQTSTTQSKAATEDAKVPVYEVVSVKPNKSDAQMIEDEPEDGFKAKAITLQQLVALAYAGTPFSLIDAQVEGAPSWFRSEKFDIDAKVDDSEIPVLKKVDEDDDFVAVVQAMAQGVPSMRMKMLQTLLADRFKMKTHYVTKELPVYALVVVKRGPKVKEAANPDPHKREIGTSDGGLDGKNVPLSLLPILFFSAREVGRPVIDETGLKGYYDFDLKWTPEGHVGELSADAPPGLFTAIQEQLGLKLEPTKGPVRVLVIDHVERPAAN
ncbi:MAG: TIGR03435 family protein [Edaphobacter sp.]